MATLQDLLNIVNGKDMPAPIANQLTELVKSLESFVASDALEALKNKEEVSDLEPLDELATEEDIVAKVNEIIAALKA